MTDSFPPWLALAMAVSLAGAGPAAALGESAPSAPGHVTGFGGVFVTSKDPKALAAWYRDVLGMKMEAWGGAMLRYDAPGHPAMVVWSPFPVASGYLAPSTREFMIDFGVDDLDAVVARLKGKGVTILKRDDKDPNGRFAWILDPDGTKLELWEPRKP